MRFPNLSTLLFLLPYNLLYVISYDEKKNLFYVAVYSSENGREKIGLYIVKSLLII